jgi:PAS domain-containing protein
MVRVEVIIRCHHPYPHYAGKHICLAALRPDGFFELLSPAWESLLGFAPAELHGRPLLALFRPAPCAPRVLLRRIVDPDEPDPIRVELRRRDGARQAMHWYRRFDFYDDTLFIAGEPAALMAPAAAPARAVPGPI